MSFSSRELQRKPPSGSVSPRDALRGKGIYKPGMVWTRKCDREKFTLKEVDHLGLVFKEVTGHFDEQAFIPPF